MARSTDPVPGVQAPPPEAQHELAGTFLETGQLASDRSIAVERAHLGQRARIGLWTLRVFALVVSAMVIYTFVAQLH